MNYLTNYYKNMCEDLEKKVNFLEQQLNEFLASADSSTKPTELILKTKKKIEKKPKQLPISPLSTSEPSKGIDTE